MRVFKLQFRTPGIFLDRETFKGKLYFEVDQRDGQGFVPVENTGILVLPEDRYRANAVVTDARFTSTIEVPTRDSQNAIYYMIVGEGTANAIDFRIVADQCPDCWDLFQETHQEDKILEPTNRKGRIIVGQGTIGNED